MTSWLQQYTVYSLTWTTGELETAELESDVDEEQKKKKSQKEEEEETQMASLWTAVLSHFGHFMSIWPWLPLKVRTKAL